ncbi:MAG: protein kinase [Myxococcales bacterium]|nr:protein kinase [Myxococcales bacterium]
MTLARQPKRGDLLGGKYRLARRIGIGGMGEVWVARNRATRADVAVKLCLPSAAEHLDAAARFRQEARLGAMLSHRSVVRIFDLVEESDGTLVLVMELLRGETLGTYLEKRGALPCDEALAIALPLLSALAHAHALGVVHRDVTPANIFLAVDPDGQVIPKLVDFGIAKLPGSGQDTMDGRALGTPRYMSPEQIRGQRDIDGRSDLFSVAVVLYEMMSGICPFHAKSTPASLAAVLEAVVDPDPGIEPRVWLELQRALSKRPYERHAGAAEMADALRSASGVMDADLARLLRRAPPGPPSEARDRGATMMTRTMGGHSVGGAQREVRRARATWLAASVLAACLAIGATVALRHARSTPAPAMPSAPRQPTAEAASSPDGVSARSGSPAPAPSPQRAAELWPARSAELPPREVAVTPFAGAHGGSGPATSPATAAPSAPRVAPPAGPKRARPVATTPGF